MTPFQWISPAISSPKVMARSARGDKCSLCGMDRACDLDATAEAARFGGKMGDQGASYGSLYLGKNMVKEWGFLHFFSKLINCILKRWNIPVIVAGCYAII